MAGDYAIGQALSRVERVVSALENKRNQFNRQTKPSPRVAQHWANEINQEVNKAYQDLRVVSQRYANSDTACAPLFSRLRLMQRTPLPTEPSKPLEASSTVSTSRPSTAAELTTTISQTLRQLDSTPPRVATTASTNTTAGRATPLSMAPADPDIRSLRERVNHFGQQRDEMYKKIIGMRETFQKTQETRLALQTTVNTLRASSEAGLKKAERALTATEQQAKREGAALNNALQAYKSVSNTYQTLQNVSTNYHNTRGTTPTQQQHTSQTTRKDEPISKINSCLDALKTCPIPILKTIIGTIKLILTDIKKWIQSINSKRSTPSSDNAATAKHNEHGTEMFQRQKEKFQQVQQVQQSQRPTAETQPPHSIRSNSSK